MAYNYIISKVLVPALIITGLQPDTGKCLSSESSDPPKAVYKLANTEGSLTKLPDGNLMLFKMDREDLISVISSDGYSWGKPKVEIKNHPASGAGLVLVDKEGELHSISTVRRDVPQKPGGLKGPAATIMYDIWHRKTINGRKKWESPKMIFEGYCGAVLDFKQLSNGRLIVPFAFWVAGQSPLPTGSNISTVVYSDDNGKTWKLSDARLTSPAYEDYPGNNYGAIEPSIVELEQNSHLYMLMRTSTGFLYESYSVDYGTTWSDAVASRFFSFNGPPLMKKLPDGKIFMVWNNSDNIPKIEGIGVYGGRDAIHAAISDDNGRTWKGFREIHRDPLRNETPPKTGDRGTAYANSPIGMDNKVILITGMGENRRHIVYVDTEWLTAKHHECDFSNGLEEWTVFKQFGPITYWWRDRVAGPQLKDHPFENGKKVLHIRRPDDKDPDGAVWNFPNGLSGKLTLRIFIKKGFKGGGISLTDRFFNPSDNHGERLAMFYLPISDKGQLGHGPNISSGKWHTIDFIWDLRSKACVVNADGEYALILSQRNETLNGLSYLRLRSMASEIDTAGYYVESVVVDIDDNIAPPVSKKEKLDYEIAYRAKLDYNECHIVKEQVKTSSLDKETPGKITSTGYWIHNKAEEIIGLKMGPFLRLPDGSILAIDKSKSCISKDEGKTWTEYPIVADQDKFEISPGGLVRTGSGVIILPFSNNKERANWNWRNDILDSPDAILPTYAVRSLDGGKTWQDLQKLHNDWTGANRDMIITKNGNIVFTSMMMRHNPGRHTVVTYTSMNDGLNWIRSNVIDLGGIGNHGGVTESTIVQLNDGRLWMLLRTNWGVFWETYSDNEGLTWKQFKPTKIDASSAPGILKRIQSGRLVLVWNRYFPEGKNEYPLRGGDGSWSEVPVSNHREELSIMFSDDDGKNWSTPIVFARITKKGTQLSYPDIFEAKPGELWVTTQFAGNLRVRLYEKDFN